MATIASLNVLLTADSSGLQSEFNKASRSAEAYDRKITALNAKAASGTINQADYNKQLSDATSQFQRATGAAAIIDANRTALERYNDRIAKASNLFKIGALSQQQFTREVNAAKLAYEASGASLSANLISKLKVALPAAAIAAGAAMLHFTKNLYDTVDANAKLSRNLGLTIGQLETLKLVADLADVPIETVRTSFQTMFRAIADAQQPTSEAAKAFSQLGITFEEISALPTYEAFKRIAGAIAALENRSQQYSVAQKIFGRGSRELIPILTEGTQALDAAEQRIKDYNLATSKMDAKKVEDAKDAFTELGRAVRGTVQKDIIGSAGPLKLTIDLLTAGMPTIARGAKSAFLSIVNPFQWLVEAGQKFKDLAFPATVKDVNEQADEAEDKLGAFAEAMDELGKKTKDTITPIQQLIDKLEDEINTFGMSARKAEIYRMALTDATTAELEHAQALMHTIDAMEEQQKKQQELAKEFEKTQQQMEDAQKQFMDDLAERGKRTFEETRTPIEKAQAAIEDYNEQLAHDVIDQETYARAVQKVVESLKALQQMRYPPALEFGSQAAESAINAALALGKEVNGVRDIMDAIRPRGGDGAGIPNPAAGQANAAQDRIARVVEIAGLVSVREEVVRTILQGMTQPLNSISSIIESFKDGVPVKFDADALHVTAEIGAVEIAGTVETHDGELLELTRSMIPVLNRIEQNTADDAIRVGLI